MATTANGWPYVTPSDTVTSYPTTSAALANKLEAGSYSGMSLFTAGPVATGTTLATIVFPALPVATSVMVIVHGYAGNAASAADVQIALSLTGATITAQTPGYVNAPTGKWLATGPAGYWTQPASTVCTLTVVGNCTVNSHFRGGVQYVRAEVLRLA